MRREQRRKNFYRPQTLEQLEPRLLLALDWRNPVDALDVNGDRHVTPVDALWVANDLHRNGSRSLPANRGNASPPFVDVNGDGFAAPSDAVQVIDALNAGFHSPYVLDESEGGARIRSVIIGLGQDHGPRVYMFGIEAQFDSRGNSAGQDRLEVFLFDPRNPGQTLLHGGEPNTPIFVLDSRGATFSEELVRFDGAQVQLNLGSLDEFVEGRLEFRLVSESAKTETRITISPLSNELLPGLLVAEFPTLPAPADGTQTVVLDAEFVSGTLGFDEIGLVMLDDDSGSVDGVAQDDTAYVDAILTSPGRLAMIGEQDAQRTRRELSFPVGAPVALYVLHSNPWLGSVENHVRVAEVTLGAWEIGWEGPQSSSSGASLVEDQSFDDALIRAVTRRNRPVVTNPDVQLNPSLAVNPLDPDHVVVAYMDWSLVDTGYAGIGVAVSRNGGLTWEHGSVPVPEPFNEGAANPQVDFDDQGRLYVAYTAATFLGNKPGMTTPDQEAVDGVNTHVWGFQSNNGLFVVSSDTGGATWNEPAAVVSRLYAGQDVLFNEHTIDLIVDRFPQLPDGRANPNYGNLYVVWSDIYPAGEFPGFPEYQGGGDIFISVSSDSGITWETQLEEGQRWIDGNGDGIEQEEEVTTFLKTVLAHLEIDPGPAFLSIVGPQLGVGPQGGVYSAAWSGGNFAVEYSNDGAASFQHADEETGHRLAFGPGFESLAFEPLANVAFLGWLQRDIAADPTRPGHVYATTPIWNIDDTGQLVDPADVFFARSSDFGETWEPDFTVGSTSTNILNDDNDGQIATGNALDEVISGQGFTEISVDDLGNITVIWADQRRDPDNKLLDVFGTVSNDGGETFSPNFRITDTSFDGEAGSFLDARGKEVFYFGHDMSDLQASDGLAYLAWTDTRAGNRDIYFSQFSLTPTPEPLNDRFEPNDTLDGGGLPTDLGRVVQRQLPKLTVAPSDEDWFSIEAAATGDLIATLLLDDPASATGNAVQLELWDRTRSTRLTSGDNHLDSNGDVIGKELRLPADSGDRFLVRVIGTGSESARYALRVQSLTADLGRQVYAEVSGSIEAGGGSLFRVTAAASGSAEVQIIGGENVQGELGLQVIDPETLAILSSGESFLTRSQADSNEPNDSIPEANSTGLSGPGLVTIQSAIGDGAHGETTGDFDFYSLVAEPGQKITATISAPELDSVLSLYNSDGELLKSEDIIAPGGEVLTHSVDEADTYFVVVSGYGSGEPDPFASGTGEAVGFTGVFDLRVSVERVGPGAVKQASLPVQKGDGLLLLVNGVNDSSGDFGLTFTNRDQFSTLRRAAVSQNEPLRFPAGHGPGRIATGDFNGDGVPDLVVSDALADTVNVLLANGDGTFQAPRQFEIGAFVRTNALEFELPTFGRDVAVADFNQDEVPDIVVTNFASSDVSVLLGRGDGAFEPHRRFEATRAPIAVDSGDLNADGIPDLTVLDLTETRQITAAVLLARGDGTFEPQRTFSVDEADNFAMADVLIADFDKDGNGDLAISRRSNPRNDDVRIFLGNGDGTFELGSSFLSAFQGQMSAADLNGDEHLDLVVTEFGTFQTIRGIHVHLGNGDGTFTQLLNPATGQPDFFSGNATIDAVLVDIGSEVINADSSTTLGPPDGRLDIVAANTGASFRGDPGGPEVVVLPAKFDDDGNLVTFGEPQQLAAGKLPQSLTAADFNSDGAVDIAAVDLDAVMAIYRQQPNIPANDTPATARDYGTVVHLVEQTHTIVPGNENAFYKLTLPTEVVSGAGDEVIDFSGGFEAQSGGGLSMEVLDADGNVQASGERFRLRAAQGEELTLHVFGVPDSNGRPGNGAYTLAIDVLPQVVSLEAQALLPGATANPGGPTTSFVLTLQGDRLDRSTAEDAANYVVRHAGADGITETADDVQIPIQEVVYSPSTNVDISSGRTFPTAVRQTVTLDFADALPAGSYVIDVSSAVQTAPFNDEELGLLSPGPGISGHPVVSLNGQISEGSHIEAIDAVLASGALGGFDAFNRGTPFLSQLHADLGAVLDATLTTLGEDPSVTPVLIDQALTRLTPTLGQRGQRPVSLMALWLDPVSIDLRDEEDESIVYDLDDDELVRDDDDCYVEVGGNVELVICAVLDTLSALFSLNVANVSQASRGGVILIGQNSESSRSLTDDMRAGVTSFRIEF